MPDPDPTPPDPAGPAVHRPGAFHLGCAVWGHPGWVGPVFPAGTSQRRQLEEYVLRFAAVEGNSVFHGLPLATTVERWRRTMPAGFQMVPKLPREVTHAGPLMTRLAERDDAPAEISWSAGRHPVSDFANRP